MSPFRRAAAAAAALAGAVALTAGLAAPASAAPSDQDVVWLVAAHQSNLAEIAGGQAAQEQATTDTVRDLGAMFVEHHTALDQQVTALAEELGVELPDAPTPAQQAGLAEVADNSGEEFDTAWVALQLAGHRAAIAAGEEEIAQGSDQQVVSLARTAAPVIQQHYDELVAAADQYGVPTGVPAGSGGQVAEAASSPAGLLVAGLGGLLLLVSAGALVRGRRRA